MLKRGGPSALEDTTIDTQRIGHEISRLYKNKFFKLELGLSTLKSLEFVC